MDEPTNYTPSDLIYLFLDGEASGMQQAILFGALAGDSELQSEFSQALHMRGALESERSELHPPAAVTRELFAMAGFGAPVAEAIPVAASGAAAGLLGRLGLPFLFAAAGALITALLFGSIYRDEINTLKGEVERAGKIATALPGNAPTATGPVATDEAGRGQADFHVISPPPTRAPQKHFTARSGATGYPIVMERRAATTAPTNPRHPSEQPTIGAATPRSAPMELRREDGGTETIAKLSPLPAPSSSLADADESIPFYRYSTRLRGITDLRFYPDRELSGAAQPWYGNTSVGGLYHITPNHAVGIEIGEDRMPMYRASGTGFVRDDRLFWAGGSYQLRMNRIEALGGVQPFFEGIAGATVMGPIGKGMVGISYAPEGRVSIGMGVEGTALLYQLRGEWHSTRKAGVTYLMNVEF